MITRRRALAISAMAACIPSPRRMPRTVQWTGTVMGAAGSITLQHPDETTGRQIIESCLDEIARLEASFSLYRADSEVSRLNAAGFLDAPSHDMRQLLAASRRFARLTGGAFDPTVQPLYQVYADHFRRAPDDEAGPNRRLVDEALRLVDWRGVIVTPDRIDLARSGMAITLNGIAQGYIADAVAARLRAAGFRHVLLDLGEMRALGGWADDRPFRVAIKDPSAAAFPTIVPLSTSAMATSGGYGTQFDRFGRFHHLLDPGTGRSPTWFTSVTVLAPTATEADALSTAAAVQPPAAAVALLSEAGVEAILLAPGGAVTRVG